MYYIARDYKCIQIIGRELDRKRSLERLIVDDRIILK
jgi:hypothetical protein